MVLGLNSWLDLLSRRGLLLKKIHLYSFIVNNYCSWKNHIYDILDLFKIHEQFCPDYFSQQIKHEIKSQCLFINIKFLFKILQFELTHPVE